MHRWYNPEDRWGASKKKPSYWILPSPKCMMRSRTMCSLSLSLWRSRALPDTGRLCTAAVVWRRRALILTWLAFQKLSNLSTTTNDRKIMLINRINHWAQSGAAWMTFTIYLIGGHWYKTKDPIPSQHFAGVQPAIWMDLNCRFTAHSFMHCPTYHLILFISELLQWNSEKYFLGS